MLKPFPFLLYLSVCVLAETAEIQALLSDHGVSVQTMSEVLPIRVLPARILSHVYVKLGKNRRLPHRMSLCICASSNMSVKVLIRPAHLELVLLIL